MTRTITVIILLFLLAGCSNELKIQKGDDFQIEILPYHSNIQKEVKLQFNITSLSSYIYTTYNIRYFQKEGLGTLKMDDGRLLQENETYILPSKIFSIDYIVSSGTSHIIQFYFTDSSGNSHDLTITLNVT